MAKRWHFLMTPLEHTSLRYMDDVYRSRLAPSGRVMFWGLVASSVLVLGGLVTPLLAAMGVCLSALLLAGVSGALMAPRVRVERRMGAFPTAGETFTYTATVANVSKRTLRGLVVEERGLPADVRPAGEAPVIDELGPGESRQVTMKLLCQARGAFRLPALQAASVFPSGLIKWGSRQRQPEPLLVLPRREPPPDFDVPVGRNLQPGGVVAASHVADSTEFMGTRAWRPGDRVRDVHWPSWARTGQLVVKEFQEEYFVRLALILDTQARTAKVERRMERAIRVAAGMAEALAGREYIVDVFACGDRVHHLRMGRSLAHMENLLELLAGVEADDDFLVEEVGAELLGQARSLSGAVFIMLQWDEVRARLVRSLKEQGVAVRVLCLGPGHPGDLSPQEWMALS